MEVMIIVYFSIFEDYDYYNYQLFMEERNHIIMMWIFHQKLFTPIFCGPYCRGKGP